MRRHPSTLRQELSDELDKLKTQMNANGGDNDGDLNVTTVRANFRGAAAGGRGAAPSGIPRIRIRAVAAAMLGRIENSLHEPGALAPIALRKHLIRYPRGDPRAVTTLRRRHGRHPRR